MLDVQGEVEGEESGISKTPYLYLATLQPSTSDSRSISETIQGFWYLLAILLIGFDLAIEGTPFAGPAQGFM